MSLALFVLGCGLTAYGLIAWRGRQKKQDADEDEVYRQRRELGKTTQASDDDREKKLDREALDEDTASEAAAADVDPPLRSDPLAMQPVVERPAADEKYRSRRQFIKEAEGHLGGLLGDAFADTHLVEKGVRIGADSSILDLVARAKDPSRWSSFAIEIRLVTGSISTAMRLRDSMLSVAIAARDVPEGQIQVAQVGRPPVAKSVSLCFVIVADEESSSSGSIGAPARIGFDDFGRRAERVVRIVNTVLARKVGVIVVAQSRFADVSTQWLRQSVLEVMRRPESIAMKDK